MAVFAQTFDAANVDPNAGFELYPAGKYLVQIIASEMRPTKDGRGQYLYLELDILDGQFAGRKLFDRLNLVNDNQDTVDIAKRALSSICRATGQMQVKDSEQLHLIPLIADVRVRPPKGQYGESNSIRYLPRNAAAQATNAVPAAPAASGVPTAPAFASTPAAPANPAASAGLPWKRQA